MTNFVVKSIRESKVQDKVELFLKELPLIAVPDDSSGGIYARFDGDAIPSTFRTRDVAVSAFTWTTMQVDEAEELELPPEKQDKLGAPREKGYMYVSSLPGMSNLANMEAFSSRGASPGLVDNETMRVGYDFSPARLPVLLASDHVDRQLTSL